MKLFYGGDWQLNLCEYNSICEVKEYAKKVYSNKL